MFPVKTMLAVATLIALLVVPRWIPHLEAWASFPPESIRPAVEKVWEMPVPEPPTPPIITLAELERERDAALAPEHLLDLGRPLDHFFEALYRSEEQGGVVRVAHFGDSPTTADLITADVRAMAQKQFGDAGHGFLLIARPWAWYNHRFVTMDAADWNIEIAGVAPSVKENEGEKADEGETERIAPPPPAGPKGVFGLGGARFRGTPGAEAKWTIRGQNSAEIAYLAGPELGVFELLADGEVVGSVDAYSPEQIPAWVTFALPEGATEFMIRPASGTVTLFGVEFRRDRRGVVYSSLGINGASITMLSRIFDRSHLTTQLRHYRPDLVVLAYGTNESGYPEFVDGAFEGELRNAIRRVKAALPNSSILVMSPMDRGEKKEDGTIDTLDSLERLVTIEARVAAEEKVGFFNTFAAMGGRGTIAKWYAAEPRMVGADLIHPMPQGARIVGELLYNALSSGYKEYKRRRQNVSEAKPPADPVKAAPQVQETVSTTP